MKRFKNILCVAEAGETSTAALERAVTLAANNQARLTVIDVVEQVSDAGGMPAELAPEELQTALKREDAQRVEALVAPYRDRAEIGTKVLAGTPFLEIIREVLRGGHDLVIKTPQVADWLDRLFGSDDMHLLRKCPCPVWLIKPNTPKSYRRILAAVDASTWYPPAETDTRRTLNLEVLKLAASLALSEFAELHVVYVWDAIGENAMRGAFLHRAEDKIIAYVEQVRHDCEQSLSALMREANAYIGKDSLDYLKPRVHLVKGWARKEIPLVARRIEAELVVMGTVARTGIPGFIMGNTAEMILNQLDCSVFAIKPPGFVTPITLQR